MSFVRVIAEGPTDVRLVLRMLPESLISQCKFVMANGKNQLTSVARTHLTINPEPVVLIADADSTDVHKVAEERRLMQYFISQAATEDRFRIVLAEPEIEAIFFTDIAALGGWLGVEVTEAEAARAEFVPKIVLGQLIERSPLVHQTWGPELTEQLPSELIQTIRQHPIVRRIETAIEELLLVPA